MNRILRPLMLLCLCSLLQNCFAQDKNPSEKGGGQGYEIPITLLPYKKTYIYLGCYYGKGKSVIDSAFVDENSKGVFKGKKKLTPGIYFVVSPKYVILFELLMDNKQRFSIYSDTTKRESTVIKGSPDNDLFKRYSEYSMQKGKQLQELGEAYHKATTKADSTRLRDELIKGNKELEAYRDKVMKENPESLLTALFNAMKLPDVPQIPVVNGKADSTYPYHYVKGHYWDDVSFNDDRLLRTPFFESKLDDYFKKYISPEPDSIYKEIKYMLLMARTGKEIFPYLLTKYTNKYISPEIMGQDKVFLRICEDFYLKGDTTYLNEASRKTIIERYYSLMANQLGLQAPTLALIDTNGKKVDIYSINGNYTFIAFWDPTCGHCKEEIPRLDSIYKAKWKKLGVKIYTVNVNESKMDEWKKFIAEKKLSKDWAYVYQTKEDRDKEQKEGLPNYRQLYDMFKTPTFYLLDDTKKIVAKQLGILQFDELLMAKLKKKKSDS